ncbi:hypothetical protein [Pseudoalteromonas denitrificans]|uniref:Uncharacterized protein n=1 Tax=Pseudoalteromonas denitrificans DSM 6059 TaxID=1123010 RepID=A0A1I1K0N5_9GAMM|nr:hypothetical protein [Pseudoalteromonas denitrificans]SFC52318.1 hypothetical protein SAMN02745724_01852 [Pseudoalteromonas denitrificans DSM 6059]
MIQNLITNKLGLFVIVLTSLWIATDINSRLSITSETANRNTLIDAVVAFKPPQLSKVHFLDLKMAYKKYQSENVDSKPIQNIGMSEQDQARQKGELSNLFIGENKLTLKAVINRNISESNTTVKAKQLVALILIENVKSGESEIKRFSHNDQMQGFVLTIDKNTQVNFTKRLKGGEQKVTLTMYDKGVSS